MSIRVPLTFEDYLHGERADELSSPARCEGCRCEGQRCWRLGGPNRMVMCEACLRGFHGDERGEIRMLRLLLGGAVKAALGAEIPAERIRAVVDEAIDEDLASEASQWAGAAISPGA